MIKLKMNIMTFMFGGVIYSIIEILFRGYTHWSMTITGGICLMLMYRRYTSHPYENIFRKCLYGAIVITSMEFLSGCIVNLWLGWEVWDYSSLFMNLFGQVCLLFTALWYLLSFFAVMICSFLRNNIELAVPAGNQVPAESPAAAGTA